MPTSYTSLLGLALPVTGELQGTWGDVANNSITSLLDTAISGTTTLTTDADVTLTTTTGSANQARQAIILWAPVSGTVTRYITAPAQSKTYVVINKTGGTQSIVIRGVGPTTGVTVAKDEYVLVAWTGSDFVRIAGTGGGPGVFTTMTVSSLTSGRVTYAGTGGLLQDNANFVFDGTNFGVGTSTPGSKADIKGTLRLSGSSSGYVGLAPAAAAGSTTYTLPTADGTTGQALTTNGTGTLSWSTAGGTPGGATTQVQFNNAGVFAGSANLTFNGTTLTAAGLAGPLTGTVGATTQNTGYFTGLRMYGATSGYVGFQGATAAGSTTYTLPSTDGTVGQALTTNGTGTLSWAAVGGTPGGSTTQIQYNNAGVFGGTAGFTYDSSTLTFTAQNVVSSNGLLVNGTTVYSNFTIATGNNGISVGPMTVNSGVTVTVSSGQQWVVI